METAKNRNSNIEFLKILVMFMFVLFHVSNTVGSFHPYVNISNNYFFDSRMATKNIQFLIIIIIYKYLGGIGNNIFLITSVWYLLESNQYKTRKIVHIILDVWAISIIWLLVIKEINVNINFIQVIKSIFPTTTGAYWYITCYLLLYIIHPLINTVIEKTSQKELLKYNIIFILLYCIIGMFGDFFYFTRFVRFIVIYMIVAYLKKYSMSIMNNRKINKVTLLLCILVTLFVSIATNILGLHIHFFQDKVLLFAKGNNPIIILIAITTFNLFRTMQYFYNSFINKWASLLLYVYIIHENFLFGTFLRPYIFVYIKNEFGYNFLSIWVFVFAMFLFIVSSILGWLYSLLSKKLSNTISSTMEKNIKRISTMIINKMINPNST